MTAKSKKKDNAFRLSRVLAKNILYALIFCVILISGLWFWLEIYTGHNESVVVPELKGLTLEEAGDELSEIGLNYLVVDSIWSENTVGGTVVDQIPQGGKRVKENRKILVTIYRYAAEAEILGVDEGEVAEVARIKLRNKGIHFDTKFESNLLLDGMVIRIEKSGKKLGKYDEVIPGQHVTLVIGQRGEEKVAVPNVYGMTLDSAKSVLLSANLSLGAALYSGRFLTNEDSLKAVISKQSPQPNEEFVFRIGSGVDIWLQDPKRMKNNTKTSIDSLIIDHGETN